MNRYVIYSGIFLLGVFISAVAQIMLKKSAQRKADFTVFAMIDKFFPKMAEKCRKSNNKLVCMVKKHKSLLSEYLNLFTMIAYTVFIAATFLSIFSYKVIPLSFGPILGSLEYIFVAVLSRVFLKEKVSKRTILGLAIIIMGVLVFTVDFSVWKGLFS